jgi:CheY-like chemotaxis protein
MTNGDAAHRRGLVFLVDDDQDIRETLEELLEQEGFLVLNARDGHEALARMRGFTGRAVAIVDLMMPEMDGHKLIETMRADAELSRIPVIVITAGGTQAVPGATQVFAKPLSKALLLAALDAALRVSLSPSAANAQ